MSLIIKLWPVLLLIIFIKLAQKFKPSFSGYIGEQKIKLILKTLPNDNYAVFNNIMLNTRQGTTQVDHIVVSCYGVFVIETKNYKGWIYGNDKSNKWTQVIYKTKHHFINPIHQNYKHCLSVKELIGNDNIKVISIIAFSGKATLKINTYNHVVYYKDLIRCITHYDTVNVSLSDCEKIINMIQKNNIIDRTAKKNHITEIEERVYIEKENIKNKICPKCGGQLVQRSSRYGLFTGCNNYPNCKYKLKH